ncbi:alpha-L-rhamnosidase [Geodermatophilus normandii]|uniref:alpha-L-rhamnosidase n=1 Tax=Geodermatophilus normandii TaxID=1137989 RepID=A0A317QTD9_9ACTN|nr:glycoside hydrolase family 78 protein [Geodermatophilus normandii]PWW25000.1 alpha-L-rhamnosidase [Geodermatophilus normandii]
MSDVTVAPVTVEHHRVPLGIGGTTPRLSWVTATELPGWRQSAYELEIGDWSSGRVDSADSVLVPWGAPPLASRERRTVRVRVWGQGDAGPSAWSEEVAVEAGLLAPADWTARLVRPVPPTGAEEAVALLRREFTLDRPVTRARLYATAQGVYEAELNGTPVDDAVLSPGWTSYRHRLRYRTTDVTGLLREGANALGVHLAEGWFTGYLGFTGKREWYGDRTGAFLQLEVEHPDGSRTVVTTDGAWRSTTDGPTVRSGLYSGETVDFRRDLPGWSAPGFDDAAWTPVEVADLDLATLVAPTGPPVRRTQVLPVQAVTTSPSGRRLVDFGQNLVGRIRFALPDGPAGTQITVRHAEVLEHGELGTRPLKAARATDVAVLDGRGPRTWEPRSTFHGFRYAEVSGWPGELRAEDLEAVVLHTDLRRTGTFSCSDPEVERLHENVVWGMRGNFLDIPTDCPQRDERLGWTGDLQVFAPTASFLHDTTGMLRSWLADLAVEQREFDGVVPMYVPFLPLLPFPQQAETGWGDAAVVVPWVLYQRTGDAGLLADQWGSMTAWVDAFAARAGEALDFPGGGFSFGDWLDTAAPPDNPAAARTPWQCVATAYLARSARTVAQAAEVLGHDGTRFAELGERAAARFRAEYVSPNGRVAFPSQTAYALALEFDLLEPGQREHAGRLLAQQVLADGFHIASGFLGTPLVTDALTNAGELATAYALLLQRENPSWLYAVTMGATTIWERWDSMLPDGTINPGEMTSFNHYAFGAVADWLHRTVAGLAPAAPGYRRIRFAPRPGPGLTSAAATHETPYGTASVSWALTGGTAFALDVVVPPNTSAEVVLPDGSAPVEVGSGRHAFACAIEEPRPVERPALFFDPDAHP